MAKVKKDKKIKVVEKDGTRERVEKGAVYSFNKNSIPSMTF